MIYFLRGLLSLSTKNRKTNRTINQFYSFAHARFHIWLGYPLHHDTNHYWRKNQTFQTVPLEPVLWATFLPISFSINFY